MSVISTHFDHLPKYIFYYLLSFVSYKDIGRLETTCKSIKKIIEHKAIWKLTCNRYSLEYNEDEEIKDWKIYFKQNHKVFSNNHSWFNNNHIQLTNRNKSAKYLQKSSFDIVLPLKQSIEEISRVDFKICSLDYGLGIGLFNKKKGDKYDWLGGNKGSIGWGKSERICYIDDTDNKQIIGLGNYYQGDIVTLYFDKRHDSLHFFKNYQFPPSSTSYSGCGIKLSSDFFEDYDDLYFSISIFKDGTIIEIVEPKYTLPIP